MDRYGPAFAKMPKVVYTVCVCIYTYAARHSWIRDAKYYEFVVIYDVGKHRARWLKEQDDFENHSLFLNYLIRKYVSKNF